MRVQPKSIDGYFHVSLDGADFKRIISEFGDVVEETVKEYLDQCGHIISKGFKMVLNQDTADIQYK